MRLVLKYKTYERKLMPILKKVEQGVIVFIEEALPFVDVVPTFSIMWTYNYYLSEKPSK